jgi:hypothetical protein
MNVYRKLKFLTPAGWPHVSPCARDYLTLVKTAQSPRTDDGELSIHFEGADN